MPRENSHFLSLATLVSSGLLGAQIEEFSMLGHPGFCRVLLWSPEMPCMGVNRAQQKGLQKWRGTRETVPASLPLVWGGMPSVTSL